MGERNKLLLPVGGLPLIRRTVESYLSWGLEELVVVVGFEGSRVNDALSGLPVRVVDHPEFAAGRASSVRTGLSALEVEVDAVAIGLGDLPEVTTADLFHLAAALKRSEARVVVPVHEGHRGHPVLVRWEAVPALLAEADGPRAFVDGPEAQVEWVEMDSDRSMRDIDTPEDYEALLQRTAQVEE